MLETAAFGMDNFTHTFAALALVHAASADKPTASTLTAAVIAANVQDLDSVPWLYSTAAYHEIHRGITHAVVAVPIVALAVVVAVRRCTARSGRTAPPLDALLTACLLGAISHPLLDWLNPYGVKPFLPFDDAWYYGDLLGIVDPWMWLILGGTALLLSSTSLASVRAWVVVGTLLTVFGLNVIPLSSAFGVTAGFVWIGGAATTLVLWLRGSTRGLRRQVAVAGLTLTLAYVGAIAVLHERVVERAARTAAAHVPATDPVVRVVTVPKVGDLSRWRAIVETPNSVYRFFLDLTDPTPPTIQRFDAMASLPDPVREHAARDTRMGAFLRFARLPGFQTTAGADGIRTLAADTRYDAAVPEKPETWSVELSTPGSKDAPAVDAR